MIVIIKEVIDDVHLGDVRRSQFHQLDSFYYQVGDQFCCSSPFEVGIVRGAEAPSALDLVLQF